MGEGPVAGWQAGWLNIQADNCVDLPGRLTAYDRLQSGVLHV